MSPQETLAEAFRQGNEARSLALLSQLGGNPREVRATLESMLTAADARFRQAAAFGLGELGGAASTRRLEQQLAIEEARGDHDGASVAEAITRALGRLEEAGARASLVKRLERLAAGRPTPSELYTVVYALWKRRHPGLLPAITRSLERLPLPAAGALRGLHVLLEKPPEELRAWVQDPSIPVEHKAQVLAVLEDEVPDTLLPVLPAFISTAHALVSGASGLERAAGSYCECLLSVLLAHRERGLHALPSEALGTLRTVALRLLASPDPDCALRSAILLQHIGRPEDASNIEAHRPADPIAARAFDEATRALRRA
ncbi:MAG TPA: hypothetical protein VE153_06585 [Myxococcus sp.]|nr:hypothetical protein [Myxococcus sp.]